MRRACQAPIFPGVSAPEKISLSGLSRGDLEALTERLLAENAALQQTVGELRAEIARLKGVAARPAIKPSGMEQKTEPKAMTSVRKHGTKERKTARLVIHEERIITAAVPAGSRFKGYEDFVVQDLVVRPHVVRIRRERWVTPEGLPVLAPMPAGVAGQLAALRFALPSASGRSCAALCCCSTIKARSPCRAWLPSCRRSASRSPNARSSAC